MTLLGNGVGTGATGGPCVVQECGDGTKLHPRAVRLVRWSDPVVAVTIRSQTDVPSDVLDVLRTLREAGFRSFLAGGCVRDALRKVPPVDFDVATPARPERVIDLFPKAIPTGLQHGTVTVVTSEGRHVEVTTFRGDGTYTDGRRPDAVRFLDDVTEDLARRDFTINAIAWDPLDGTFVDPFDGQGDFARSLVKAVRDPVERFREDGLRPLRAVRFASTLGFRLDPATFEAIGATREVFRRVAAERVRDELEKLLVRSEKPSIGLQLLADSGLMADFAPELLEGIGVAQNRWHAYPVWEHVLAVVDFTPPRLVARLSALLHDIAKPRCAAPKPDGGNSFHGHEHVGIPMARDLLERLKFPRKVIDAVTLQVAEHQWHFTPEWSDGALRRHLMRVGPENLDDFFALRDADIRGRGLAVEEGLANVAQLKARIDALLASPLALSTKSLALSGGDLVTLLGRGAGPHVGTIQRALLQHVLDHPEDNTAEALSRIARSMDAADS